MLSALFYDKTMKVSINKNTMSEKEIQKEIENRVKQRCGDILNHIDARLETNGFERGATSLSIRVKKETLLDLKQVVIKEMNMTPPYNNMEEIRVRGIKDEFVEKLSQRLLSRGGRDYYVKQSFIADTIISLINTI